MSRRRRSSRLTVRSLPLVRDDLVAHNRRLIDGDLDDTQLAYAQARPDWQPEHVNHADAELWWVSPDMTKLVTAAYKTFPDDHDEPFYAPSMSGILIWDGGLDFTAHVMDSVDPDGRIISTQDRVIGGTWGMTRNGFAYGIIVESPEMPLGIFFASPPPGVDTREENWRIGRALMTTWALASQPSIVTPRTQTSTLRRAWVPKSEQQDPSTVTIATLRRLQHPAQDTTVGDGEPAHYSHRFLVRGHWRNQACGPGRKMRKPVWVVPHVKGPEAAPFLEKDKVNVWRR